MLFSRDLKLKGTNKTLSQMREKFARDLRANRRKGVVPVFISTLWFLFSLGITIQAAFYELGSNAQAHDLAMGLFVSWFPILILCSIVDRNPVASDDIQRKLNKMIDLTCESLQDFECREDFIASFRNEPEAQKMAYWVRKISRQAEYIKDEYFHGFAGQGRVRFHYGAAHAILIDLEKAYIAEHGRNWLANEHEARMHLMLGQVDKGLVWFDGRQFWQIASALLIVVGTGAGGFILSYFTPTVGLACRSGGFAFFGIVSLALLLAEFLIWFWTSPIRGEQLHGIVQQQISESTLAGHKSIDFVGLATTKSVLAWMLRVYEATALFIALLCTRLICWRRKHRRNCLPKVEHAVREHFMFLRSLTARQWWERCFLQPLEVLNTLWLCYLILGQTFGLYNTCECMSSMWAPGGGYVDFTQWDYSTAPAIEHYWITGTCLTCIIMGLGMIYICIEWCVQAHLSTEDYDDAMKGLKNTRRFRRLTFRMRYPASAAVLLINRLLRAMKMRKSHERKTLVWTKSSRYTPSIRRPVLNMANTLNFIPFTRAEADEEMGEKDDRQEEEVARPSAARVSDRGEDESQKRGSVTMQPLLDRNGSRESDSPAVTRGPLLS